MFDKYEKLTHGALSAYILELSIKGYTDDHIAIMLYTRWSYLFSGLSWFDWSVIVSEYRSMQ